LVEAKAALTLPSFSALDVTSIIINGGSEGESDLVFSNGQNSITIGLQ